MQEVQKHQNLEPLPDYDDDEVEQDNFDSCEVRLSIDPIGPEDFEKNDKIQPICLKQSPRGRHGSINRVIQNFVSNIPFVITSRLHS